MEKNNLPTSSYVGKRYAEDKEKIGVIIKYTVSTSTLFDNFNIDLPDGLHIRQISEKLYISLDRTISKKLYDDVLTINKELKTLSIDHAQMMTKAVPFVLGYIRPTLPVVNREIISRKYREGHILAKTFSITDIFEVAVLDKKGGGALVVWPSPLPGFPPSKELASFGDVVFIRDIVEAMTSYFHFNFDDCIRKIITSLENCFLVYYKLPSKKQSSFFFKLFKPLFRKPKIIKLVNEYIIEENFQYKEKHLKIIRQNIKYIYHIRNQIVHDNLRSDLSLYSIYKKAIGTLLYIYQGRFINENHRAYVYSFYRQFIAIDQIYSGLPIIDMSEDGLGDGKVIENNDDMDDYMFGNLEITKDQKDEFEKKSRRNPSSPKGIISREALQKLRMPYILTSTVTKKENL